MSRTQEKNLGVSSWRLKRIARMYKSGISMNEISEQINLSLSEVRKILKALGYRTKNGKVQQKAYKVAPTQYPILYLASFRTKVVMSISVIYLLISTNPLNN